MTINFDSGYVPDIEVRHRLYIARDLAKLEKGELADLIGVSRNTIGNYEGGDTTHMRKIVLKQWALACGVSLDWIMTGESPHETPPNGTHTETTG